MIKSCATRPVVFFVFLLPFLALLNQASAGSSSLTISIDHDDGGRAGDQYLLDLVKALNDQGCNVVVPDGVNGSKGQLVFDSRPVSIAANEMADYQLIARARTLYDELTVRGAILVQASTGIEDLITLQGELIAFVGKDSWSGYHMPLKALHEAGVTEERDKFSFSGNHVGAVSALLHRDVFATVTAEPLARRWAEANELSVVAVSDEVGTSGWWLHQSISEKQRKSCMLALSKLERSQLKALPAWIGGFEVEE